MSINPDLPQLDERVQTQDPIQMIPAQVIYVHAQDPPKTLSVFDIYCKCEAPQFDDCQTCVGCCTACFSGCGLCCCICYYGANKLDTCNVCLSGLAMWLTSYFIIGWVVACIVGCQICYSM